MQSDVIARTRQQLQKVLDLIKNDIATLRTGRATPAIVENIVVKVYGGSTQMRIMELATIAATDTQTLVITPFDASIIQEMAKGIQDANVGLNPVVDSQYIRISIPPLSADRRQELIKAMKQKLENGKVMVRQVRHEGMDGIKKEHDNKTITDDEQTRLEKDLQKIIDDGIEMIEGMGKKKEEELLAI
ncbi:MAG TPA: ribosome recycling factor [Patescibacteria group bacterium]|nr:ribosome recycling factor [Patescibacteria group bacterium]